MEGYTPATYGDAFADVYDDWFATEPDTADAVAAIVHLAGEAPVLELGVGTGRLAGPVAARGRVVVGIDASTAMLARLGRPAQVARSGGQVRAIAADMAALPLAASARFGLVLAAYNTLFNLPTAAAQRRCFAEVARVLAPDGRFAVEAFVPDDGRADGPRSAVEARTIETDRVVLVVSRHEPEDHTVSGQHVEITEHGIRLRPWHLRYSSPAELDSFAAGAGLALAARWGDWAGATFDASSTRHVSVYVPVPR